MISKISINNQGPLRVATESKTIQKFEFFLNHAIFQALKDLKTC
jgi:hypothetical protein